MHKNPFPPNGGSPLSFPRLKPGASRGYSVKTPKRRRVSVLATEDNALVITERAWGSFWARRITGFWKIEPEVKGSAAKQPAQPTVWSNVWGLGRIGSRVVQCQKIARKVGHSGCIIMPSKRVPVIQYAEDVELFELLGTMTSERAGTFRADQ